MAQQDQRERRYPERGIVRVVTSSMISDDRKSIGCGGIASDEEGRIIEAWTVTREEGYSPVVAEFEVVRIAMVCAHQQGWKKLELQLDTKALVHSLNRKSNPTQDSITLAEDIFLWFDMYDECRFCFGHRGIIEPVPI